MDGLHGLDTSLVEDDGSWKLRRPAQSHDTIAELDPLGDDAGAGDPGDVLVSDEQERSGSQSNVTSTSMPRALANFTRDSSVRLRFRPLNRWET